jgi:hypothetical protein
MQFRIYPMRRGGRRLPWREIENGPSFVGTLQSYRIKHGEEDFEAVSLLSGSPAEGKPLPDLYEPVLEVFAVNAFVLRGYERVETDQGAIGVVQEWQCRDP